MSSKERDIQVAVDRGQVHKRAAPVRMASWREAWLLGKSRAPVPAGAQLEGSECYVGRVLEFYNVFLLGVFESNGNRSSGGPRSPLHFLQQWAKYLSKETPPREKSLPFTQQKNLLKLSSTLETVKEVSCKDRSPPTATVPKPGVFIGCGPSGSAWSTEL